MYLRPSDIRFSQDSIGRTFGRCTSHPYKPIGETLDDILKGLINVNCIPGISVYKKMDYGLLLATEDCGCSKKQGNGECVVRFMLERHFVLIITNLLP